MNVEFFEILLAIVIHCVYDVLVLSTISIYCCGERSWKDCEMFSSLGNTTELGKFLLPARIETIMI